MKLANEITNEFINRNVSKRALQLHCIAVRKKRKSFYMVSVIYEKRRKKRFSEMLLAPSMFPLHI